MEESPARFEVIDPREEEEGRQKAVDGFAQSALIVESGIVRDSGFRVQRSRHSTSIDNIKAVQYCTVS